MGVPVKEGASGFSGGHYHPGNTPQVLGIGTVATYDLACPGGKYSHRRAPSRRWPPRGVLSPGDRLRVGWLNGGRGTTRAEDAHGTPTQRHISPILLVYGDKTVLAIKQRYSRQRWRAQSRRWLPPGELARVRRLPRYGATSLSISESGFAFLICATC